MRFRTLGPLEVFDGTAWQTIGAAQPRVVLAILLAEAGRVVSTDRLVDEIWADRPPRAAANTVQSYVGRLRRMTGGRDSSPLVTRGRGYELAVGEDDLDATVFERIVASVRLAAGRPDAVAARLGEALALWRGPALADVPATPTVAAEAARLEQCRLGALEERIGADLELGRHAEVVDELRRLADEHPVRERLRASLMVALYRCDRRAEALAAYREGRRVLVAELGVEPGPELRAVEQAILAGSAGPAPTRAKPAGRARPGPVVPAQLPAGTAGFTGRAAHLDQLDALLPNPADGGAGRVLTIAGTAGVGKTTLAVHWAHRVRDRFPDGQLYVNLRGHAAGQPLRPVEALARFLPALGVPAKEVPVEQERAAAVYRGLVAGRRFLILLDNAGSAEQVRPLLPATPGCVVLVTSRDQLGGLVARDGAVRLTLDALTPAEAEALLTRLLGADRVAAEPEAVTELARLCACLPLALRIAAANLGARPRRPIAEYAAELRGGDRLAALEVDGDPQSAVRAAFDLSYAALPPPSRRLFRLLGLVPGPDVTAPAAAALGGIPPAQAVRQLDLLAAAHLVDEPAPGRYAFHDLLRLYAAERAEAEDGPAERRAARDRLDEHYLFTTAAAAQHMYPQILRLALPAPRGPTQGFPDHVAASAWLDAERPNLVAAARYAAAHGRYPTAWRLADALRGYLHLRAYTVDWLAVAEAGLAAAEADGEPRAQAAAQTSLGMLDLVQGRHRDAIGRCGTALARAREAGWREGESVALASTGLVHWTLGQLPEAAEHYTRALALDRQTGWRLGEATKLANLGLVCWALGRLAEAADHQARAEALHRQAGAVNGAARDLTHLGDAYHGLGRLDEARDTLEAALVIHREIGDRNTESGTVRHLATVHRDAGRVAEALDLARTALALARDTGDPLLVADALATEASVLHLAGDHEGAVAGHREAVAGAVRIGNRYIEAEALIGLAGARRATGDLDAAAGDADRALAIARDGGYRVLEGQALTALAAIHLDRGAADEAAGRAEEALAVHEETGHRLGAARTHLLLERLRGDAGHQRAALDLFAAMGAPWRPHARLLLADSVGA